MKKHKLILGHDMVVLTKDYVSDCAAGTGSSQGVDIEIPDKFYVSEEEKEKYP